MVVVALAIGYLLAGSEPRERTTFGARMPGLKLAVLAYLLVTVLLSIAFLGWCRAQLRTA
jgi:hypothetical protein